LILLKPSIIPAAFILPCEHNSKQNAELKEIWKNFWDKKHLLDAYGERI
jgi:hypothetical protein